MELELANKKLFEGMEIECYVDTSRENGDFYMTRKQIGEALEYENINSFHKVIQRNKEIIGEPVMDNLSTTDGKTYETEIYSFSQLFQILRFSKQPKANLFMDWASLTLQELITSRAELKFKNTEDKTNYENKVKDIIEQAIKEATYPLSNKIDEQGIQIINPKQAGLYMKHGLECKCYWNIDKIVYEFNKKESKPLFDLWCKRELK